MVRRNRLRYSVRVFSLLGDNVASGLPFEPKRVLGGSVLIFFTFPPLRATTIWTGENALLGGQGNTCSGSSLG
jgi:hypothetical protein